MTEISHSHFLLAQLILDAKQVVERQDGYILILS